MSSPVWQIGVARRRITPPPAVELAGLGYYLNRKGVRVRDDLNATALTISGSGGHVALVALDLMWNDAAFTETIRREVASRTKIPATAVCVNFSHTHSAPTAGLILGAGAQNSDYLTRATQVAAEAVIAAWQSRVPAIVRVGESRLTGMTFNRTRENGPIDTQVSVLRANTADGAPLAVAVNFHSHCIAHMEADLEAVSRDWPGEVVDQLEAALPGATALYLQGTCGDVNFKREYNGTERRFEPARAVTRAALEALNSARVVEGSALASVASQVTLPTRRWTREEIMKEREEGLYRLNTGDTTGWLDGVAKVCVNLPERLPLRYGGSVERAVAAVSRFAVKWTDLILPTWETAPEQLEAEVQAIRIGDIYFVATPCELFTTLGLAVRDQGPAPNCFMCGYSNGSIGYLPDAFEIEKNGYAAIQSPKMTGQFPFTPESGNVMAQRMIDALARVSSI